MTKLEQCVRLVHAIDPEESYVETSYRERERPVFWAVMRTEEFWAYRGEGATLEEAIEALHGSLKAEAVRMRLAVDVFDSPAEEVAP